MRQRVSTLFSHLYLRFGKLVYRTSGLINSLRRTVFAFLISRSISSVPIRTFEDRYRIDGAARYFLSTNKASARAVMDVRERDGSHSGPADIKRPWEEEGSIEMGARNDWRGSFLPPMDSRPSHGPQQARGALVSPKSYHHPYARAFEEPEAKRPRYESNVYHTPSGALASSELNGHRHRPRPARKWLPASYSFLYVLG